ncbi:MAG: xylulokinase [Phycisphaeraceae bacterium]|nr:MAG: xylulokinase [Phycisphaeraceae bacterium]
MLLGIDCGTSSTKAILIDGRGSIVGSGSSSTPVESPRPGWTQQDPVLWWEAAREAVARALAGAGVPGSAVRAVGLSGQMHGSVLLDVATISSRGTSDDALFPALLWNDQRTAGHLGAIAHAAGGSKALVERVGNAALTGFTLPKLLWIKQHHPEVMDRAAVVMLPKDYLRFRLTGEAATDVGDASGTLMFSPRGRAWDTDLVVRLGLNPSILPRVIESGEVAGTLSRWAAERTGLRAGTPVIAGSGDNQTSAVGAGVTSPGDGLMIVGTSGVIYTHSASPRADTGDAGACGRTHLFAAADGTARAPGAWCVTGCILSAAGSLQWLRDTAAPGLDFETLIGEAWSAPPGAEGLIFLPYLAGERCPHQDPSARGAFVGLSLHHGRGHLARAVIEGVSFALDQVVRLQRSLGVPIDRVRLTGGAAQSHAWARLLADLTETPIEITDSTEGSALGAALLAGVGIGDWSDVREAGAGTIRVTHRIEPGPLDPALRDARETFSGLYAALKPAFSRLSATA